MTDTTDRESAAEDLAYIRHIMEETRLAVARRGDSFIVWGIIVLLGLLGNYLFILFGPAPGWAWAALWGGLTLVGWTITLWRVRQLRRAAGASTPTGRMLGSVWLACSIAAVILLFSGVPLGVIAPLSIGPITMSVFGIGLFLTGSLMGTPWVRNLAFGWWACAVAELYWHDIVQLLISAIGIFLFFVVPGIILNLQTRRAAAHQ